MSITILNRQKHYRGHAFDVSKVQIRLPDGRERFYDLVEHVDSVAIIPVDAQGNIYFVSQPRIGSGDTLLELPAGVMDEGETPLQCAKREVREEIGFAAGEIRALGGFYLAAGYSTEYMTVFLATKLYESPLTPDEDEFISTSKMPVVEVFQKAQTGEFQDGKTLAALLLAQPHLNNKS